MVDTVRVAEAKESLGRLRKARFCFLEDLPLDNDEEAAPDSFGGVGKSR